MPPDHKAERCDRGSWLALGAMTATLAVLQMRDLFLLRIGAALLPFVGLAVLALLAFVGWRSRRPRLLAACLAFLQISLFTLLAVALSYAVAAHAGPLHDPELRALDRALGFHSEAVARWIDRSAPLSSVAVIAYHSLIPQMIVAVVALSATARFGQLRVMVLAALLSGFATILLSGLVPALGALVDPEGHRHLPASVAWTHHERILALRSGALRTIDFSVMTGIVSFPSYHAALGVIFIWSFREVRAVTAPGTIWGIATILATPTIGGHYAVDVLAGLVLGLISLRAAQRVAKAANPGRGRGAPPAHAVGAVEPVLTR